MLPAELVATLTRCGPDDADLGKLPVLPVQAAPEQSGGDAGAALCRFTPRRIRFHKEHAFFEDGDIHRHLYLQDIFTSVSEVTERPKVSEFCCHLADCSQLFDTLEGYEHHYNTLHRNVCSFCKRSFPSGHFLDVHILEWHDSYFQMMSEKQNMYQCLVEGCLEKFKTSRDRKDHLIKVHLYPSDFRFDKPKKTKCNTKLKKSLQKKDVIACMDLNVEDDTEQSPVDSMELSVPEPMESTCTFLTVSKSLPKSESPPGKQRVPSTICFGHNAIRGFKSSKKKK
ncbi:zinc finger protein 511 isoform X2 [Rhinatrema bivittatum]|uniref:zinc finger protein 511 isoform X2 n=1 Tax=Rhinatrema bivittatum TaxID=194408 RepID=UPI00112D649C|nr:zinc finger protein 511 isoform X2 [Rhinatrema bivittatum]